MTTTTQRILTTSDVAIKQVAIEIKVMKIDKKQMTLAVFRQLQSERIIDPQTGKLMGIPWGRVNYHTDCDVYGKHLHIIWQKGNELRRAIETIRGDTNLGYKNRMDQVDYWAYQYILTRILEESFDAPYVLSPMPPFSPPTKKVDLYLPDYDETIQVALTDKILDACDESRKCWATDRLAKERRMAWDSEKVFERICQAYEAQSQYAQILVKSYDQLNALDQLFIAV